MTHIATTVTRATALLNKPTLRRIYLVYRVLGRIVLTKPVDHEVSLAHAQLSKAHQLLYPSN